VAMGLGLGLEQVLSNFQHFDFQHTVQHFDRWACTPKISYDKKLWKIIRIGYICQ